MVLGRAGLDRRRKQSASTSRAESAAEGIRRQMLGRGPPQIRGRRRLVRGTNHVGQSFQAAKSDLGLPACAEERQVGLLDGNLYDYPILFMTGHGNVAFSEEERKVLREYLLRGGLLFADDNYGLDTSFRRGDENPFPQPPARGLGQPPSRLLPHWKFPQGLPKIHEHDGKRATAYVVAVEGRGVVFYSYESDLGNGWEDHEVYNDPLESTRRPCGWG